MNDTQVLPVILRHTICFYLSSLGSRFGIIWMSILVFYSYYKYLTLFKCEISVKKLSGLTAGKKVDLNSAYNFLFLCEAELAD